MSFNVKSKMSGKHNTLVDFHPRTFLTAGAHQLNIMIPMLSQSDEKWLYWAHTHQLDSEPGNSEQVVLQARVASRLREDFNAEKLLLSFLTILS